MRRFRGPLRRGGVGLRERPKMRNEQRRLGKKHDQLGTSRNVYKSGRFVEDGS